MILLWILMCIGISVLASKKNRSWLGFLILSMIFSPIAGILILLIVGEKG